MANIDPNPPAASRQFGDPIVDEARKRWNRASEWEAEWRERYIEDIKFANGDSRNGWQWPNAIRRARDVDIRPCLTLNVVKQHNRQIINDQRQNKSAIKCIGTGGGSSQEAADMFQQVIRRIEYISAAQEAYQHAFEQMVDAGQGAWRITTNYASAKTFDQEIYIDRVVDPLSIYMDPDARKRDKSDAKWAFVFDTVSKEEFEDAYPKYKGMINLEPMGVSASDSDWVTKDHVRVCEYFRKVSRSDTLYSFMVSGKRKELLGSLMPDDIRETIKADPLTKSRPVEDMKVEWILIVGDRVADSTDWITDDIPLILAIGEETVIDGRLDRRGHTRAMIDAQRMFNYNSSSQVEFVALQGKTPWIAPAAAIEEMERYWNTANTVNHSVMPWNHIDDQGNPIPPPIRQEPPKNSDAFQAGMDTAFNQMMMVSGQWQNQMGMQGNERTGAAIQGRQQQGDTATFHFRDNFENALVTTGKQLIKLVPLVYETKRVMRMQADDGTDFELEIDPQARQAFSTRQQHDGKVAAKILNPTIGQYDVQAQPGQAYGTRRQQTVEAMTLILTQNPALTGVIGDLLLQAMDFKEAQEAAARMRRMVPPEAMGVGPTKQEQMLQQRVTALTQALGQALGKQAKDTLKLAGKDQMRDIDAYKAETDRIKALADQLPMDPEGLKAMLQQLVGDALNTSLLPILQANKGGIGEQSGQDQPQQPTAGATGQPPADGARQAPDGHWYLSDPTRQGKYLRVEPLAQRHVERSVTG